MFKVTILTIFPEIFPGPLGFSLAGAALKNNIWNLDVINIRDFGIGKHKKVDDTAFGGGNGLIMRPDVIGDALDFAILQNPNADIFYMSPRGIKLSQSYVKQVSQKNNIIILCGRFEGIDERIIEEYNVSEVSMGDFILSGGEIAAIAFIDCCLRLVPGVIANQNTLSEESFNDVVDVGKLLEYPQYTKPSIWKNRKVPEVLTTGNHQLIKSWRKEESLRITKIRRPDLLT